MKLLVLQSCLVFSQHAFYNSGNLRIHSGASVTIFGDLTNSYGAVLVNNGNLYSKSAIVNNEAGMSAGTGTLYLDGASLQVVSGSEVLKVNNLVTDNTAGIALNNNLSLTGNHQFVNGLIGSSVTPNYLIYESGATHSGATDSRHVTGWIKKIGSDNFIFPVGDNSFLRTIAISSLSVAAEFNCHYYRTTPNIYNLQSPIVKVRAVQKSGPDIIPEGTG
ncbi:MAG: hypothetical protein IPG86_12680 [Chitinophagaceae bacterium]|nr:hypothetical protein [Chitinophagaceae bacterium]